MRVTQAELAHCQGRLETLSRSHGRRDGLATHLEALAVERQQPEAELTRLRGKLAALGGAVMERDLALVRQRIEAIQHQIEQLIDQRRAAKQRCDSISAEDPYAAVEQDRVQLELGEAEARGLQRLTGAHQLLRQPFPEARAARFCRSSEPLALAMAATSGRWCRKGPWRSSASTRPAASVGWGCGAAALHGRCAQGRP